MSLQQFSAAYKAKAKIFEEIFQASQELLNHDLALKHKEYLNSRISKSNQDKFGFGYFPDNNNLNLLFDKVSEEKLIKSKIIFPSYIKNQEIVSTSENEQEIEAANSAGKVYVKNMLQCSLLANHGLITPYRNIYGHIVGFVGRTILPEAERKAAGLDKYKYTSFVRSFHLYGLYQSKLDIIKRNAVVLVEGQIDAITCHEFGGDNVISLGGLAFTKHQFGLLRRLTDKIYLLLDSDEEAKKAQKRIIKKYSEFLSIIPISLPDNSYKDIDVYLKDKKCNFQDLIKG